MAKVSHCLHLPTQFNHLLGYLSPRIVHTLNVQLGASDVDLNGRCTRENTNRVGKDRMYLCTADARSAMKSNMLEFYESRGQLVENATPTSTRSKYCPLGTDFGIVNVTAGIKIESSSSQTARSTMEGALTLLKTWEE
jgi:hypothetical protein